MLFVDTVKEMICDCSTRNQDYASDFKEFYEKIFYMNLYIFTTYAVYKSSMTFLSLSRSWAMNKLSSNSTRLNNATQTYEEQEIDLVSNHYDSSSTDEEENISY